jgi:DNA-binding transcriptional MerR regulator
MTEASLTLSQLAECAEVEVRTLRSWIQQGILPGPETVGRNARYPPEALTRARAVKAMRDLYGLSLPAIRQDLLAADEGKIKAYAAMALPAPLLAESLKASTPAPPPGGSSAADYLRSLRTAGVFGAGEPRRAAFAQAAPAAPTSVHAVREGLVASESRLAKLAEALERIAGARPPRRKSKGEVKLHIPITPDLELTVRGDHSPEEIGRFELIADLLRVILTGGADRD